MESNTLPGEQKIEFTGDAKEYFGIWLSNLVLSIVTLGVYSSWAKVRRETYFKNNTKISESSFGYHATGKQIFKGRLIALAVLILINIILVFLPFFGVLFIILVPVVLNASLKFSARMTSYRNIRFNWHGTYWKTFWFLAITPLLGILTLGLLTPLISKSYYSYFARSHSYGTTRFVCQPTVGEFYFAFLVTFIPIFLLACLMSISKMAIIGPTQIFSAAFYALIFSIIFIYPILCRNLMVKALSLDEMISFDSTISPIKFIWIALSNWVVTIFSLGLLMPWAKIRMYRYLSDCTLIKLNGNFEQFIDEAKASQSSFGEAVADFEGIEVSI
jgi:uncharacterized membrane protein YjgN (DUF898 family)